MEDLTFDLFDPDQTQNMWELMGELRSRCPVSRPTPELIYLATYEDNAEVFKRARKFSSRDGFRAPGTVVPDEESFLGEIDPPLHTDLRKVLHSAFTPRAATQSEDFTRRLVEGDLQALAAAGGGDLMGLRNQAGLCARLPVAVSADALGFDESTHAQISQWCQDLLHSTWIQTNETERGVGIGGGFPEFAEVLDSHIAARRASGPAGDLLDAILGMRLDGAPLSVTHLRTLLVNVLAGGLSTTSLLGNVVYRFVTDSTLEATLRADRSLVPEAVEECLRLDPPVLFLFRTVTEDVELSGETIVAGERVVLGIASANRDERVFDDSSAFRLDRALVAGAGNGHLSFGLGSHLCLGIHFARMQGKVLLETVMDTFEPGQLQLAPGYDRQLIPTSIEYGPERLDLVVR